jgi:hypothetical protein
MEDLLRDLASLELLFLPDGHAILGNTGTGVRLAATDLSPSELVSVCKRMLTLTGENVAETHALRNMRLLSKAGHDASSSSRRTLNPLDRLRRSSMFWDYAVPGVLQKDAADMLRYQEEEPHFDPASLRSPSSGTLAPDLLSHPLITLAHEVFDAQAECMFHSERVHRKRVPSLGARHGLTCRIVRRISGSDHVEAIIRPDAATVLADSPRYDTLEGPAEVFLVIEVEFEKYQWRYRNGWVYQCVYLDLGHIICALRLVAGYAGMCLSFRHVHQEEGGSGCVVEPLVLAWPSARAEIV